ncbi:MAG: tetratricopeptide repeat protein [Bacteroidetes bacterium]|nr:tetratricopeptide repeat protein [Bacteroidota bacterium]
MDPDSVAINYFEKAHHYYMQSEQLNLAARAKHNQGLNYYNLAKYANAIDAHKTAYNIFKKVDFKPGLTQTLNSLGINFMEIGDYPKSLNYHLQSLKISQNENDSNNLCQELHEHWTSI